MDDVITARAKLNTAEQRLRDAIKEAYPIGMFTAYKHGRNWVPCEIISYASYDSRVRVRGNLDKEYWVDSYRLQGGGIDA